MTDAARTEHPDLAGWRDAVVDGGMPTPGRERWQAMRGGVVGLWEFEVCEYWFADGRAQLMGRNESGKSTLMTLTTLILLAGDTSPHNIDTIGGSNKRFRYYVEPTGNDDDRRDATKSTSRGWAWVEYGRMTERGPEFITTLLYANAKRGGDKPTLTWVISDGPHRVRDGITLLRSNTVVLPGEACSGPGWHTFPNDGRGYRDHLAKMLFGADPDRLAGYVRMLKVIRTPKLGAKLNLEFLDEKLREALPPLAAHEVDQLANGWDELDRIAADRDSADEARSAVEAYVRQAWQPWAHSEVRRAADGVVAATNDLDEITRRAREARIAFDTAEKSLGKLERDTRRKQQERTIAFNEADVLRRSQRFLDAEAAVATAELLAENATDLQTRSEAADRSASAADDKAKGFERRAERAATEREDAARRCDEAQTAATEAAVLAGVAGAAAWIEVGDIARLDQAQRARRSAIGELRKRLRRVEDADRDVDRKQELFGNARDRHAALDADVADQQQAATTEAQTLVERVGAWPLAIDPGPTADLLTRWADAIDATVSADRPTAMLRSLIERDHLAPLRTDLSVARGRHGETVAGAEARILDLERSIELLRAQPEPSPAPPVRWTRRARPAASGDGAPLWLLLDPRPGVDDSVIDRIEAGLAAMGVLDAWVTSDGLWRPDRDGDDAVLDARPATSGPSLADILQVADGTAAPLAAVASEFLHGVSLDLASGHPVAINTDGRWRSNVTSGRAAPATSGAELLGTAARQRGIERQIAAHGTEIVTERGRIAAAKESINALDTALERLADAEKSIPDDADLVGLVLALRHTYRELVGAETKLAEARTTLATAQSMADTARAAAAEWAAAHALPLVDDELGDLLSDLHELNVRAERLRGAIDAAKQATTRADELAGDAINARRDSTEAKQTAASLSDEAAAAKTRADAAAAALDGETQQILGRVQELDSTVHRLDTKLGEMRDEREKLVITKTQAEGLLTNRNDDAESARVRRNTMTDAWLRLADSGLTDTLGLPPAPARNYTAALEAARVARNQIRPNNWPERDVDAQAARIERAWERVNTDSLTLRGVLEANAGRGIRLFPGDDDQPARVEIVIDGTGQGYDPPTAVLRLAEQHDELRRSYDENMHRTLHELLGSAFIEHLRDRLVEVETLTGLINEILAKHPTGTTQTMLRLKRVPRDGDPEAADVLRALEESSYELLSDDAQQQVRTFLQNRIGDARDAARAEADADWRGRLVDALDYRFWFSWSIDKRSGEGGRWTPLTSGSHGKLSGGASVVTLMLPLVATLAAMYGVAPSGPRPVWLDEAFDGVDAPNRSSVLGLLKEFDLDYLLAGPGLLVKAATVPVAAIWEVVRAPHPLPGADLELTLWASGDIIQLTVPDPVKVAARDAAPAS